MSLQKIMAKGRYKPSESLIRLAESMLLATVNHQSLHEIVDGYQRRILAAEPFTTKDGERITKPEHSYLLDEGEYVRYHAACRREQDSAGLKPLTPGNCPALEAGHMRIQAEHALVQVFADEVGEPCLAKFTTMEHRKTLLGLILNLVTPHMEPTAAILARHGISAP